jgi:hypothetical protein
VGPRAVLDAVVKRKIPSPNNDDGGGDDDDDDDNVNSNNNDNIMKILL